MKQSTNFSFIAGNAILKTNDLEHPVHIGFAVQLHAESSVGKYTFINAYTAVFDKVKIGRFCSFGKYCEIGLPNHPDDFLSTHPFQFHSGLFANVPEYTEIKHCHFNSHEMTSIGHDVWVGSGAMIKTGVSIGNGAIIAAGAVVTKNVPDYAIVGGVPAKLIRMRFPFETIAALLELKWWELEIEDLKDMPFNDIDACIGRLRKIRERG